MVKPLSHYHTSDELDQIVFDNREIIEIAVRKICGFLNKESNMVLVEMIILSIGLSKCIQFLYLTLDIEKSGGIHINVKKQQTLTDPTPTAIINNIENKDNIETVNNNIDNNSIDNNIENNNEIVIEKRRRTPGGIFFKLISMHFPIEMKKKIFSENAVLKYKRERKNKGVGKVCKVSDLRQLTLGPFFENTTTPNNNNNNNNWIAELNEIDEEFEKLQIF
eukprot:gene5214-6492_t